MGKMSKTKRRIDKKNSVTFKLVSRSQYDPLIADETAPKHVLMEVASRGSLAKVAPNPRDSETAKNESQRPDKRMEEQRKYGIYFDDDYNYLQHLKNMDDEVKEVHTDWQQVDRHGNPVEANKPKIVLPSSLFASNVEESEGMLSKGVLPVGPQPQWDADVVAGLDGDFDFDDPSNMLDDDFIAQAMGEDLIENDAGEDGDNSSGTDVSSDQFDDASESDGDDDFQNGNRPLPEDRFASEETKSHFTNYSMSSSVVRRNQGLKFLDEQFETLYEKEYAEETDIGALDLDDIEGRIDPNNSQLMNQLIQDYKKQQEKINFDEGKLVTRVRFRKLVEDPVEYVEIDMPDTAKHVTDDRLDCESILSTYSNLYNHPKLIQEPSRRINLHPRTGMPKGVFEKPGLTARKLKELDELNPFDNFGAESVGSRFSRLSELSIRPKDEKPEDRYKRKAALKEYRRERRGEKKANQDAFKTEDMKQKKAMTNVQTQLRTLHLS